MIHEYDYGFNLATADFEAFANAYQKVMYHAKMRICLYNEHTMVNFIEKMCMDFDYFPVFAHLHRKHFFTVFSILSDLGYDLNWSTDYSELRVHLKHEIFELRHCGVSMTDSVYRHDRPHYAPPYEMGRLIYEP